MRLNGAKATVTGLESRPWFRGEIGRRSTRKVDFRWSEAS